MVGCRVSVEWKERLEAIAAESGKNMAQVLHDAIEQYLETDEKASITAKIREVLQVSDTLEVNPVISALAQKLEAVESKLSSVQKLLSTLYPPLDESEQAGVALTSEQLALILGVTPRSVNDAASKGQEYFSQWTQRFRKGGKWTFEVINPGMRKSDRRFTQAY